MRRPRSHVTLALGAAATLVAVGLATRAPEHRLPAAAPNPAAQWVTTSRTQPALVQPRAVSLAGAADVAAVAGLPPEDIDWVLAEVTRTQTVRELGAAERSQLIAELASIRMFTVLEREAPLEQQPEDMP